MLKLLCLKSPFARKPPGSFYSKPYKNEGMMEQKRSVGMVRFIVLLLALSFIITDIAFACSCAGVFGPANKFSKADAVFIGKVIKIYKPIFGYDYRVKFKVLKSYKSTARKYFVVSSTLQPEACDYPFEENGEYLVYAHRWQGKWRVANEACGGTRKLSEASEDLKALEAMISFVPK